MKRLFWAAGALTLAASAMAQSTPSLNGFGVRLGGYYPFENEVRRVTGTMFNVGIDFRLADQGRREFMLSGEWLGRSINGGKGNILTVFVNGRQYTGTLDLDRTRSYFLLGLGMVNADITSSTFQVGLRGGYGFQAPNGIFSEAVVMLTNSKAGVSSSGVGLNVGYRF